MNKTQTIKEYCRSLKLSNIADKIDDIVLGVNIPVQTEPLIPV